MVPTALTSAAHLQRPLNLAMKTICRWLSLRHCKGCVWLRVSIPFFFFALLNITQQVLFRIGLKPPTQALVLLRLQVKSRSLNTQRSQIRELSMLRWCHFVSGGSFDVFDILWVCQYVPKSAYTPTSGFTWFLMFLVVSPPIVNPCSCTNLFFLRSCKVGKPVVVDVLNGYNGTVLAYGQTVLPAILVGKHGQNAKVLRNSTFHQTCPIWSGQSSGKTYSMYGAALNSLLWLWLLDQLRSVIASGWYLVLLCWTYPLASKVRVQQKTCCGLRTSTYCNIMQQKRWCFSGCFQSLGVSQGAVGSDGRCSSLEFIGRFWNRSSSAIFIYYNI